MEKNGEVLKEEMKMKGICLTAEAALTVNPAAMQDLVDHPDKQLLAPQHLIRRDMFKTKLWNSDMIKRVQFQSKKRWFKTGTNPQQDTLPYGYCA